MKKTIILGSVSFKLDSAKVGINWIAEYFANAGYQVTYISSASTILDVFFKPKRFIAAWVKGGVFIIKPNLTEVVFKSPWLLNRLDSKIKHQTAGIFQKKLLSSNYDILISTVGALSLFADKINAQVKILRLQDHPHDFGLSSYVVSYFEQLLQQKIFKQIWSVSKQLCIYADIFSPLNNRYLPNGVRLNSFLDKFSRTNVKSALYVGSFTAWVDIELISAAALQLPDWSFTLYGPGFSDSIKLPSNVRYLGNINNLLLPELFTNYSVGLIPFVDCPHIKVVERPLKFSQYLASGLGVASVDYGGLHDGMGDWVSYGNTPQAFAKAIEEAYIKRNMYSKEDIAAYLKDYDWDVILNKMLILLETGCGA